MNSLSSSRASTLRTALAPFLLLLTLTLATSSHAQWERREYVGKGVRFVYMLDEVGLPDVGFVGREIGGMIRTTDKGWTWEEVTFSPPLTSELYDITFKDQNVGFLAANTEVWKTTDGGLNWFEISNMSAHGILYVKNQGLLVMTSWTLGSQFSTDDGATWQAFTQPNMNGIASTDGQRIIITPHVGSAVFSTDGGSSWQTANMTREAYQPVGLAAGGMFFAVSETDGSSWVTSDGYIWEQRNPIHNPSGCVRGPYNNLIAQTRGGMMRTTNQGVTWQDICGPGFIYDTRFWVNGTEIFAVSENGYFYYNPTSQATSTGNEITINPSPLVLYTDGCTNPIGEIEISGTFCAAQLVQVSVTGDHEFEIGNDLALPYTFNTLVKVPVVYIPEGNDQDSAFINLRFDFGGIFFDTVVKVYGRRAPVISPMASEEVRVYMSASCDLTLAQVAVRNLGCDPFTIDSVRLSDDVNFEILDLVVPTVVDGGQSYGFNVRARPAALILEKLEGMLTTYVSNSAGARALRTKIRYSRTGIVVKPMEEKQFSFKTTCDPTNGSVAFKNPMCDTIFVDSIKVSNPTAFRLLPIQLTRALGKDEQLQIPFEVMAPRPGPSSSRLTVFYRLMGRNMQQVTWLYASNRVDVVLPDDTVKFVAEGTCPEFEGEFPITNIMCDSITILEMKPLFQPAYEITLPALPLKLAPNEATSIGVATDAFFKGVTGTTIRVRYEAYGIIYDTIVYVSVRNTKNFSIDPKLSKLNFGRTSVCAPQQRTVYIKNHYCLPVSIEDIRWSNTSSDRFTIIYQPALSQPIAPGGMDSVVVAFTPDAIGSRAGALRLRLKSAVVTLDTFFTVEGIGTGNINANLRDESLALGTALTCEKLTSETVIRNDGCVRLDLSSIYYPNGRFKLVSPALPYSLEPGDSVKLVFEPTDNTPGAHTEKLVLRMLSEQGIEQLIDCELSATIIKENERLLAASLALGELDGCKPFDTSVVVTNPNQCDPINVQATLSSTDATFIGANTASIPPGESATFRFSIAPNTNAGITIRLNSAEVDTSINVSYSFTAGGGQMTVSGPTEPLVVKPCETVDTVVHCHFYGCKGEMLEELTLNAPGGGPTKFSLVDPPQLPLELRGGGTVAIRVRFDPRATGAEFARLTARTYLGQGADLELTGTVLPIGTVSAAISAAGAQEVIVGDAFDVDLEMTSSGIDASKAIEVEAEFEFNTDLLMLTDVTPRTGWILTSNAPQANGALLRLRRDQGTSPGVEAIANLAFRTAFAKDNAGSVVLKRLTVNPGETDFAECVAETIFQPTSNEMSVAYFCGAETLRDHLSSDAPVKNIQVRPHPTPVASNSLNVTFDLAIDADVELELINVLGATHSELTHRGHKGKNEVQMPLLSPAKGWYVLRARTPLGVTGVRVLLTD